MIFILIELGGNFKVSQVDRTENERFAFFGIEVFHSFPDHSSEPD